MKTALTLIRSTHFRGDLQQVADDMLNKLQSSGCRQLDQSWLSPDEVVDTILDIDDLAAIRQSLRDNAELEYLDWALTPTHHRRKKLLVADMDSTMITVECIDELAAELGIKTEVSEITEAAMRGELEFEGALRKRVGLLKGLDTERMNKVFSERISLSRGARTLIHTMKLRANARAALVSGGFTFFTSRVAEQCGFDWHHGNELIVQSGKLTGEVGEPILGQEAKRDTLALYQEKLKLKSAETMAIGDGANDLTMIKEAGTGIAYKAKPIVAKDADAAITHTDLTAALYYQGYRKDEFVTPS